MLEEHAEHHAEAAGHDVGHVVVGVDGVVRRRLRWNAEHFGSKAGGHDGVDVDVDDSAAAVSPRVRQLGSEW